MCGSTRVPVLRTRTPKKAWRLNPWWFYRLEWAGLLLLARMVQATTGEEGDDGDDNDNVKDDGHMERSRRFPFDRSLLTTLVDRPCYRPLCSWCWVARRAAGSVRGHLTSGVGGRLLPFSIYAIARSTGEVVEAVQGGDDGYTSDR